MKRIITRKFAAVTVAAATMLGSAAFAGAAFAAGEDPAPAQNGVSATDLTVKTQDGKATLAGRTLTAYKLATYVAPTFDKDGNVSGYDLKLADGVDDAKVRNAIKAAVTTTGDNGAVTVADAWKNLVSVDGKGAVKFINDAANLSSVEFVAKYFYGTGSDVYGNDHADKAEVRKFANAMRGNAGTGVAMNVAKDGSQATLDVSDEDLGVYLIVDETDPAATPKNQTLSFAMLAGTVFNNNGKPATNVHSGTTNQDYKAAEIVIKADLVTVNKTVTKDSNKGIVGIGSTRTFQIDTNVPNYKTLYQDFKSAKFVIKDNPTDNVTVSKKGDYTDVDGLKVQHSADGGKTFEDMDAAAYTVATIPAQQGQPDDPNDWQITLNDPADWSGQSIRVTYNATISDLVDGATSNDATVEYSNNPYEDTTVETDKHTNRQYEADLDLSKWDFQSVEGPDVKHNPLTGAEFQMYDVDPDTVAPDTLDDHNLNFLRRDITSAPDKDGKTSVTGTEYRFVDETASDALNLKGRTPYIEFDGLSKVSIRGLARDTQTAPVTYWFEETKAPAGYLLGEKPVKFSVTLTPTLNDDRTVKSVKYVINAGDYAKFLDQNNLTGDGVTVAAPQTGDTRIIDEAKVENTTSAREFAKTGADILTYLALTLAAAVLGGGLIVAARRRMSNK